MDTIGSRVRDARQRRGMSRADLARAAGLSGGAVSRIESGERSPGAETLARLSRALGVELDYLMGGRQPAAVSTSVALPAPGVPPMDMGILPAEVIEAIAAVARAMPLLPEAGRRRVLKVLRAVLDGDGDGQMRA